MPERLDIVVAGGGPVGTAFALAMRESGLSVALVEPRGSGATGAAPFRPIVLSDASRLLLDRIGIFGALTLTTIRTVHVSQAGGFGRTLIRADELGVPALGYVTDLGPLTEKLLGAASDPHLAGRVASWNEAREGVQVRLAGDEPRELVAQLLVLADGGHSGADDLSLRDYGQTAIVSRVRPERMVPGNAFERFTTDGPVALLPFEDRYALVWSVRTNRAPELMHASDSAFLRELGSLFGRRFGEFLEVGARASYPLALRFRRAAALGARTVAIGNAAQTLHPVAGQGLNLGLRDAAELADTIVAAGPSRLRAGEIAASFAAQRRPDRYASIGITEGLVRVFGSGHGIARTVRGAGLLALDLVPPARRLLARRFVFGLRALP